MSDPGLDPSHFRSQQQYQREEEADSMLGVSLQLTDEERYKDCEQFTFACPECGTDNVYDGVFEGTVSGTRGPRKNPPTTTRLHSALKSKWWKKNDCKAVKPANSAGLRSTACNLDKRESLCDWPTRKYDDAKLGSQPIWREPGMPSGQDGATQCVWSEEPDWTNYLSVACERTTHVTLSDWPFFFLFFV